MKQPTPVRRTATEHPGIPISAPPGAGDRHRPGRPDGPAAGRVRGPVRARGPNEAGGHAR